MAARASCVRSKMAHSMAAFSKVGILLVHLSCYANDINVAEEEK